MDNNATIIIKNELREKFDELIKLHGLDYKDELMILGMLTDDLSKRLIGDVTIKSSGKKG
jgi:hypothetical protein